MTVYRAGDDLTAAPVETQAAPAAPQATVIPGADSLIGDLLDMDLGPPSFQQQQFQAPQPPQPAGGGAMDLLGEGLDSLVGASPFDDAVGYIVTPWPDVAKGCYCYIVSVYIEYYIVE